MYVAGACGDRAEVAAPAGRQNSPLFRGYSPLFSVPRVSCSLEFWGRCPPLILGAFIGRTTGETELWWRARDYQSPSGVRPAPQMDDAFPLDFIREIVAE